MGEDSIKLGKGTLYFRGPEGQSLGAAVYEEKVEPVAESDGIYIKRGIPGDITLAFQITAECAKGLMAAFVGLTDAVYSLCPNKRVVHLAKYGKKERTRKKNRARIQKILKEAR